MATVIGFSPRGVLKAYLRSHRPKKGDFISVKPRGHGDWQEFKVY